VLSAAAANSHVTIVELALKKGAVVDHRNNSGQTPLHLALRYGYADVAVVLMAAGADPSLRDVDGLNGAQLANPRLYESELGYWSVV
ncbi:ankyrin repeat-containing domain protein, partial [Baffinella frigidus]